MYKMRTLNQDSDACKYTLFLHSLPGMIHNSANLWCIRKVISGEKRDPLKQVVPWKPAIVQDHLRYNLRRLSVNE